MVRSRTFHTGSDMSVRRWRRRAQNLAYVGVGPVVVEALRNFTCDDVLHDPQRHQRHHEHRNRGGVRTPPKQRRYAPPEDMTGSQPHPSAPSARTTHTTTARALSTARAPHIASATAHTPLQPQPQPQGSTAREHAALHAARTARTRIVPRRKQRRRPPGTRHHARTTTHDDEKMLRAHTGTKPETPVDGGSENWGAAPATRPRCARGRLPSSSHASVARTATRSSSQGPASALRFNYHHAAASLPFKFVPAPLGATHDTNATQPTMSTTAPPCPLPTRCAGGSTRAVAREAEYFFRVVVVASSSVVRLGSKGTTRNAATTRKRSGPSRIATDGDPERPGSGHLRTCLVAIFHCDAAAGRPGEHEHFSCLGSSRTTPDWALNQILSLLPPCVREPG